MSRDPTIAASRDAILRAATACGAHDVRVFGSAVRGPLGPESDLDLLIRLAPDRSLLDRIRLKHRLEDLLGRRVDVVNEKALHWTIRDAVLAEAVPL